MRKTLTLAAAAMLVLAGTARAQSDTDVNNVSYTVSSVVRITVASPTTALTYAGTPFDGADSFDATGNVGLTIVSNHNWELAASAVWTADASAGTKSLADLKVHVSGSSALSGNAGATINETTTAPAGLNASVPLADGTRGRYSSTANYTFTVNIADPIGNYAADVTYTLTGL